MVAAGGSAFVANSASGYINNSTDRNYEISNANGLGVGTYAVYAATKSGDAYVPNSASVSVKVTGLGESCGSEGQRTQWWKVEFRQN